VLRAWRLDIDLKGTGTVDFKVFTKACDKLGLSALAQDIWACFRPESVGKLKSTTCVVRRSSVKVAPLTFQEVCPQEGDVVFDFIRVLERRMKFDLDRVWKMLDPYSREHIFLSEFEKGAGLLGFQREPEDAALIFRGLDTAGIASSGATS